MALEVEIIGAANCTILENPARVRVRLPYTGIYGRQGPTSEHRIISSIIATMTTPYPGAALTTPDLFRALESKIIEQISLARSTRRSQNPFSHRVVSPLIRFSGL